MSIKFYKIRQKIKTEKLDDIEAAVISEINSVTLNIKKDDKIAIAVGSRGIANLKLIVKTVVKKVIELGGKPFIVPSMGSHGGATAKGQVEILESLGITEKEVGAPIKSSLETVEIPSSTLKCKIFMDKYAYESDGVIVINRIKPHTDFHGDLESGIAKMAVIGLGKHEQALEIHRFGFEGLKTLTFKAAEILFDSGKIIMGLGIVENPLDETHTIKALAPNDIISEEAKLLRVARNNMPSFPVDDFDVLLVDQMGKNISGTGVDTNVIGRMMISGAPEPEYPKIKSIALFDLTKESHGNAVGVGLSEVITKKLRKKIDFKATYENVYTTTFLLRAKIPYVAENELEAFKVALRSALVIDEGKARIIRIKDTLHLAELYISKALFDEIKDKVSTLKEDLEIFDESGNVLEF